MPAEEPPVRVVARPEPAPEAVAAEAPPAGVWGAGPTTSVCPGPLGVAEDAGPEPAAPAPAPESGPVAGGCSGAEATCVSPLRLPIRETATPLARSTSRVDEAASQTTALLRCDSANECSQRSPAPCLPAERNTARPGRSLRRI